MRLRPALAALALVGAGCHESVTGSYYPATGPVPSGLAVSLRGTASYADSLPGGPAITAAGDSVVAAAVLSTSGCSDYTARAGLADAVLVVTIVDSLTSRICDLGMHATTFRAVVRPASRGRYDVALRTRIVSPRQTPREREIARRSVTLP